MTSFEDIVDAKVQAAVKRRLDALYPEIVSIKQEMNRRGLSHSSEIGKAICNKCVSLLDEIRDDMRAEFKVMLDNAFWPREAQGDLLISKARRHLDTVADRAQREIIGATKNLANKAFQDEFHSDISNARDRALTDLSLFIDGYTKMLIRKKVARAIAYFPKLISSSIMQ